MNFADRYRLAAEERNSVLCVGLDPTDEHVPRGFGRGMKGLEKYLKAVVKIAAKKVAVIKPQYAYFAAYGREGLRLLKRIIKYAHRLGLLVILDAKKADIGSTMSAYAREVFGVYKADACTFVPYLGSTFLPANQNDKDQIWLPWLAEGRAVISMIRTSNPEAAKQQDKKLDDGSLIYESVCEDVRDWDTRVRRWTRNEGVVGGVVGATWPEQAVRCRDLAGDNVFFLIPGYGAQGGGADGAVGGLRDSHGNVMGTVNSSRGITLAWYDAKAKKAKRGNPLKLVAAAIDAANIDLNNALEKIAS